MLPPFPVNLGAFQQDGCNMPVRALKIVNILWKKDMERVERKREGEGRDRQTDTETDIEIAKKKGGRKNDFEESERSLAHDFYFTLFLSHSILFRECQFRSFDLFLVIIYSTQLSWAQGLKNGTHCENLTYYLITLQW